ncbi:MAG: putative diguanylate phosphodiesterase domain with sensor [Frankiales bacterium]|nr:putative diguanylate phosphodiesterase domain with sensor [Frankiales bacterium]
MTIALDPTGPGAGTLPAKTDVLEVLGAPDRLRIHLQPIIGLQTGTVWGLEALARFPGHPQPGPAAWFRTATRAGWSAALETIALCAALDVLDSLPEAMALTVNLSPATLLRKDVTELLLDATPGRLLIEITEHEPVHDYGALLQALSGLRSAGVRLGIDDFGAGHSSLRHVLQLAPDVVKLDISIIQQVDVDPSRQALVEAMLAFCARVGAVVIAEGVEEPGELVSLLELGVQYAQGWFLARPAAPELVIPMLSSSPEPPAVVLTEP